MRISTNTFFESGTSRLSELQARLMQSQQQISTGRRILTPADDPIAAARAYDVTQARSVNEQFATNRKYVKDSLSLEEGALQGVTTLIQDAKTLLVSAGNATLSDTERKFLATELNERFNELLSLANTTDGQGGYIFAGFQNDAQPFTKSAAGASYNGDQGTRLLQASPSRQLAFGDNGNAVFEQGKNGNGRFAIGAASSNTGSGVFSPGVAGAAYDPTKTYSVQFSVTAAGTTYDVIDTTTLPGTVVSPANTYASGQAISFNGIQFEVKGDPAHNDSFTVTPSVDQSVFTTLKKLIDTLNGSGSGAAGQAALHNQLTIGHQNLDSALNNILTVRAEVGTRLKEIDSLDSSGEDTGLQYAQTLSELQDLDYAKAISSLVQQQTTLQAAQQSFVKISGLSLFNFL